LLHRERFLFKAKKYEQWKRIVRTSGPHGLRQIRWLRDEALSGKLEGKRSSRLSLHYRVVYEVHKDQVAV